MAFNKLHLAVAKSPDGLRYWFWGRGNYYPGVFKGCLDISQQALYTHDGYIDRQGSKDPDIPLESFVGSKFPDMPANKVILFDSDINEP